MKYPHVTEAMQPTVDRVRERQWIIGKTIEEIEPKQKKKG